MPPSPNIRPPVRAAAHAPLLLSAPARQAREAIRMPRRNPMSSCMGISLWISLEFLGIKVDKLGIISPPAG
jgi:hypothetical protein